LPAADQSVSLPSIMSPTPAQLRRLVSAARRAAKGAYAPYSKFRVGAAVLTPSGRIFTGCNVENASYGLSNCAERTAVFSAVAAGHRDLAAVAVYTPTRKPTLPCGACRQVINEFGPAAGIVCVCDSSARIQTTLGELLPRAFGPKDLGSRRRGKVMGCAPRNMIRAAKDDRPR
jgi:cytidine deaminase